MEGLGVAASVIAVVELSAKVASRLFEYSRKVKNARNDIESLRGAVNDMVGVLRALDLLLKAPGKTLPATQELGGALRDCLLLLRNLDDNLDPGKGRKRDFLRSWTWPFESEEVEEAMDDLEHIKTTIALALQVDQTNATLAVSRKLDLARLVIASGAEFDSHLDEHDPRCLPDTRVDLLQTIANWAEDKSGSCIFWLNGMAGTGKSTISRTVAQYFDDRGQLGASFFFKRGGGDRSHAARFFSTIAAQLATKIPGLGTFIEEAIDNNPSISEKALRQQFEKLIVSPLSKLKHVTLQDSTLVLVVDALDECERQGDIRTILLLLSELRDVASISVRVFITSRPELPIRLRFSSMKGDTYRDVVLHEISEATIEHDIAVFLRHEFQEIREERSLPLDWPGEQAILTLVEMAVPLFIFAATVCLFIKDPNWDPRKRLDIILEYKVASQASKLDVTYLPILEQLLFGQDEKEKEELTREFQQVVGAIVVLANPLSIISLARLLNIPEDIIDCRLGSLHSVLSIPKDRTSPIRLLHLSFREFLLDPQKRGKNPLFVDEKKTHEMMTAKCIELLSTHLKKNLCDIMPATLRNEIDSNVVDSCLPAEVQYACRYWVYHLEESGGLFSEERVYTFLQTHFLHWLEAMSLMKNSPESITMIMTLQTSLKASANPDLRAFIYDARRFALYNQAVIAQAPLELYNSALLFTPKSSIIRIQFETNIPDWVKTRPIVQEHWDSCLLIRVSRSNTATFSPDGKQIAHGVSTGVVLWDSSTGAVLQTLEGHTAVVTAVKFSPNGRLVASGSIGEVRLWDHSLGAVLHVIGWYQFTVNYLAFSPDNGQLASANGVATVSWNTTSGEYMRTETFSGVRRIPFSENVTQVVSAHENHACFWDLISGTVIEASECPTGVTSAAFSPDNRLFVATHKGHLWFWDTTLGTRQKPVEHFPIPQVSETKGDDISALAFSPDGKRIAAGSFSALVWIWDIATGALLQTLKGHIDIISALAFSPDAKQLVSSARDSRIRLWDIDIEAPPIPQTRGFPDSQTKAMLTVALSPDGKKVVSGHIGAAEVWDATTGKLWQTIKMPGRIDSVKFSLDSRQVAFMSIHSRTLQVWYFASDETLQHRCSYTAPLNMRAPLLGSQAFLPDGEKIMSVWSDRTVRLWDIETKEWKQVIKFENECFSAALSSDGKHILLGMRAREVKLWDLTTGVLLRTIDLGMGLYNIVAAFSPDNKRIVVGTDSDMSGPNTRDTAILRLFDTDKQGDPKILEASSNLIQSLIFSPDGSAELGLHVSGDWVMDGEERLLWLPPDYRPMARIWASHNRAIALGLESAVVSILQFDEASKISGKQLASDKKLMTHHPNKHISL